ncbi:Carboxylesterase type B [Fusarium albosuccineum]|uniref:Carboxylesterase type B n=1 Tax=Fusarium albosuccineum TaxID=1237068 RepID=A0A8H4L328_9HYPO|nr:Carboxylesterase type B [Fusarium albosuccineum]
MWSKLLYITSLCLPSLENALAAAHCIDVNSPRSAPRVDLGYAEYEGVALSNGIDQFLGMRYAAPAIGSRRFRLPEAPLNEESVVQAHERGPICLGVSNSAIADPPLQSSEDCLFIDIYTPRNAILDKSGGLPVMLWIQGGAYVQNFNANYNGSGLIEASHGNMIVATFNYRVGPYGFLASQELQEEGKLNVGLHDQLAAMRWLQQHASAFGGDPERVTLFGTSAGGGSVLLHLLAYGGNSTGAAPQWSAGIAQSMFLPSVYTVDEMRFHYDYLLSATNCTNLECLRSLPSDQLQAANVAIPFPGQNDTALFGYGPVIDGSFLPDRPSSLLEQGRFARDKPMLIGSSNTEGTIFAPQANNTGDVNRFLKAQLPGLSSAALGELNRLYSDSPATYPGVKVTQAPLYYRAAEMYGDSSFICPAFHFAAALDQAGVPVHLYLDRILDPANVAAGYIVPHTWDTQAVWGPSFATNYAALPNADSYEPGRSNAAIVPLVQAFWTSFARSSGDPNIFKYKDASTWDKSSNGSFLNIETNNTRMEYMSDTLFNKPQSTVSNVIPTANNPHEAMGNPRQAFPKDNSLASTPSSNDRLTQRVSLSPVRSFTTLITAITDDSKILPAPTPSSVSAEIPPNAALDAPTECFMFAVYYAVVVTMPASECMSVLKQQKTDLVRQYRSGAEYALLKANFLRSSDLLVLQAFVVFLTFVRNSDSELDMQSLVSLAIGNAMRMGLHCEETTSHLSMFEVEMRRRLWWQIYVLDVRIAMECGVEPSIIGQTFNVRKPLNTNDIALDPLLDASPQQVDGKTEMTLSLIRIQTSELTRRILFSDNFNKSNGYPTLSQAQKCDKIDEMRIDIETKYLVHYSSQIPLDIIASSTARLIFAKLKVMVCKPQANQGGGNPFMENYLALCLDVLKQSHQIRSYRPGRPWSWLFETCVEWDALAYVLLDLCVSPSSTDSVTAWNLVEDIYNDWQQDVNLVENRRWRHIQVLWSEAMMAKRRAGEA